VTCRRVAGPGRQAQDQNLGRSVEREEPSVLLNSRHSGDNPLYNPLTAALNSDQLPRLKVVIAAIAGCGGSEQDKQLYAAAWRELELAPAQEHNRRAGPESKLRVLPPAG